MARIYQDRAAVFLIQVFRPRADLCRLMSTIFQTIPRYLLLILISVSITSEAAPTAPGTSSKAISIEPVIAFGERRLDDIKNLIGGPNGHPAPHIAPHQTCQQLYRRRLQLLPQTLDYKPAYWDDPRNKVAVFLGTVFAPAFYFLTYSAFSSYLDEARQIDPRIELDALRQASAQQRCFVN